MDNRSETHELNSLLNEDRLRPDETPDREALHYFPDATLLKPAPTARKSKPAPSKLFRQTYLLFLVALYSFLSIIAWVIICIQTKRPITTHTYSYVSNADDYHGVLGNRMKANAGWFRAAKVSLSISNTLIIPLTSTVCASAAVIYIQNFGQGRHFSMQHTTTLADKGWSSPPVWLALLSIKGWRSQGSYFLVFAMAFHALGFIIGPLQQYYIGQESFKFQTVQTPGRQAATDIFDLIKLNEPLGSNQLQIARLRSELATVSNSDFQSELWQEGILHCNNNYTQSFQVPQECNEGGTTFHNITALQGPYTAQLPSGYQTGLITQFMPRMNSSISFTNISQTDFPLNCSKIAGAYYVEYLYNETLLNVQVCMPGGVSQSPWKGTRNRQDITEQMFLNIHFGTFKNPVTFDLNPHNQTFQLMVNTTLGYFELPNYNNSGIAGPLLSKDPHDTCHGNDNQCLSQWTSKRSLQTNESDSSYAIGHVKNLGPLAMVVAAMFEPGSFIATAIPQNRTEPPDPFLMPSQPNLPCTVAPLNLLFGDLIIRQCYTIPFSPDEGYDSVTTWLSNFYDIGAMGNALHAAIILASQVWLNSALGSLTVFYDMGADSERPTISTTGIILLSTLLAIDLFFLLAVAAYISFSHTWTGSFDSSTMMRLGAARADELPMRVVSSEGIVETRTVLEKMPGWVGDAKPNDEVGALAVGANAPLRVGRRYQGF